MNSKAKGVILSQKALISGGIFLLILFSVNPVKALAGNAPAIENIVKVNQYSNASDAKITADGGFIAANDHIVKYSMGKEPEQRAGTAWTANNSNL